MSNVVMLHPESAHKWDRVEWVCLGCGIGWSPGTEAEPCVAGDFEFWARHVRKQRSEK